MSVSLGNLPRRNRAEGKTPRRNFLQHQTVFQRDRPSTSNPQSMETSSTFLAKTPPPTMYHVLIPRTYECVTFYNQRDSSGDSSKYRKIRKRSFVVLTGAETKTEWRHHNGGRDGGEEPQRWKKQSWVKECRWLPEEWEHRRQMDTPDRTPLGQYLTVRPILGLMSNFWESKATNLGCWAML